MLAAIAEGVEEEKLQRMGNVCSRAAEEGVNDEEDAAVAVAAAAAVLSVSFFVAGATPVVIHESLLARQLTQNNLLPSGPRMNRLDCAVERMQREKKGRQTRASQRQSERTETQQ